MLKVGIYNKEVLTSQYVNDIENSLTDILGTSLSDSIITEPDTMKPIAGSTSKQALIIRGNILANQGADALVIPHNYANIHADAVEDATGKAVIRPANSLANGAKELFIDKVGLIGTKAIMTSPVIKNILQANGIAVEIPDAEEQLLIDDIIYYTLLVKDEELYPKAKHRIFRIMQKLKARGVKGYVIGCTELRSILDQKYFDGLPILESTDLHKKDITKQIIDSISGKEAVKNQIDVMTLKKVQQSPYQIYY